MHQLSRSQHFLPHFQMLWSSCKPLSMGLGASLTVHSYLSWPFLGNLFSLLPLRTLHETIQHCFDFNSWQHDRWLQKQCICISSPLPLVSITIIWLWVASTVSWSQGKSLGSGERSLLWRKGFFLWQIILAPKGQLFLRRRTVGALSGNDDWVTMQ